MSRSENGRQLLKLETDEEIAHAAKIEECQSAIYSTIGELAAKYGGEIVSEACEWFVDLWRPKRYE